MAAARGADVYLVAAGDWDPNSATFFVLGYDIMKPVDAGLPANTMARIVAGARNPAAAAPGEAPEAFFRLQFNPATKVIPRDQENAGVCIGNSGWWATALGTSSDLSVPDLPPNAIAAATNLAQSAGDFAVVSGQNKRWIRDFNLRVVGLRGGSAMPDTTVGYLAVPANSGSVYKFLNIGKKDSDGTWRRM
jgi:hypothetical protein